MIKQGHVGTLELFVTLIFYQSFPLAYHLPNALGQEAYTGAWLLHLLAGLLSIVFAFGMFPLLHRFPGKSIIEIAEILLGRWGGVLVSFTVAGFLFYIATIGTRAFGDGIVSTIMQDTPVSAVMAGALVVVAIVSYLGLEPFTRTALIFAPFIAIAIGLSVILTLPDADFDAIYPLLGEPLPQLLLASTRFAFTVHECLIIAIIAPYVREPKTLFRLVFWSIIVLTFGGTVMMVIIESELPYPAFELQSFPIFEVVRLIYIGHFVQRVEAMFIVVAVVSSIGYFGIAFHGGVLSLAQGWKLADWRPLIFPCAVIVFTLGILPRDFVKIGRWYYSSGNAMLTFALIVLLPMALYLVAVLQRKKGGGNLEEAGS